MPGTGRATAAETAAESLTRRRGGIAPDGPSRTRTNMMDRRGHAGHVKLSDFLIKGELGRGTYGSVFKALRRGRRTPYAIKVINMKGMSKKQLHDCAEEVRILSSLQNENIIKYLDSFVDAGKLYIVMEYASHGTLYDFYKSKRSKAEESFVWRTLVRLALALQYIHCKKILHRDVKSTNVFLDQNLKARLGDFGVAKVLDSGKKMARTVVGTPFYLSPELCKGKPYNDKSDIWSLGVVMYELCMRTHPFVAESPIQLSQKIVGGRFQPIRGYTQDLISIIHRCIAVNPAERPSASDILNLAIVQAKAKDMGIPLGEAASGERGARAGSTGAGASPKPQAAIKPSVTQIRKFKFESTIIGEFSSNQSTPVKGVLGHQGSNLPSPARETQNLEDEGLVRDLPMYPVSSPTTSQPAFLSPRPSVGSTPKCTPPSTNKKKGSSETPAKRQQKSKVETADVAMDRTQQLEEQMATARATCAELVGQDELQELITLFAEHHKSKANGLSDQKDMLKLFKEANVLSPIIDPEAFVIIYRLHNLEKEANML